MHEYDTVLKALLQSPQSTVLERMTGARIVHWLNVEFSEVKQLRVDMLGATEDPADLVGVELQSANDNKVAIRMAEYALGATVSMRHSRDSMCFMSEKRRCGCLRNWWARVFNFATRSSISGSWTKDCC